MLIEKIKELVKQSMLAHTPDKDVLRCVLSDVQAVESRQGGKPATDQDVERIIRKIMASNEETIKMAESVGYMTSKTTFETQKLTEENKILVALVPKQLSKDEIEAFFLNGDNPVFEQIVESKSDGQGTGIATKALKAASLSFNGSDVAEWVKKVRTS